MKNAIFVLTSLLLTTTSAWASEPAQKQLDIEVGFHDQSWTQTESHLTYALHYRHKVPVITDSYSEMFSDARFTDNQVQCLQHLVQTFAESKQLPNVMRIVEKATFRIGRVKHDLSSSHLFGWVPANVEAEFPMDERGRHLIIKLPNGNYCGSVTAQSFDKALTKALLKSRDANAQQAREGDRTVDQHGAVIDALKRVGISIPTNDERVNNERQKSVPSSTPGTARHADEVVSSKADQG